MSLACSDSAAVVSDGFHATCAHHDCRRTGILLAQGKDRVLGECLGRRAKEWAMLLRTLVV
jgi:hypothetical protein